MLGGDDAQQETSQQKMGDLNDPTALLIYPLVASPFALFLTSLFLSFHIYYLETKIIRHHLQMSHLLDWFVGEASFF